jgi:hypothetical protein
MVERLSKSNTSEEPAEASADKEQSQMSTTRNALSGQLLNEYDQTSMRLVGSLISDFQKIRIQSDFG